jgi:uncharacterized SAM-binding protein YcdF (DUF218 family)
MHQKLHSTRCSTIILFFVSAGFLALFSLFLFAARWLPDSDEAVEADSIVVLAGDSRRTLYAADLFKQGMATRVLISRPMRGVRETILRDLGISVPDAEQYERMILIQKGVTASAIDIFGYGSISTYEEGVALGRYLGSSKPSLLVVTSPYHVRRARMILRNALPNAEVRVLATPYEQFPERWWTSQDAARDLILEITKIAYYSLGGNYLAPNK